MDAIGQAAWGVVGLLVFVFMLYALAHVRSVRLLVTLLEVAADREFFPYLDRLFPPRMSDFERAYWATDKRSDARKAEQDVEWSLLIDEARRGGSITQDEMRSLRAALLSNLHPEGPSLYVDYQADLRE